MSERESKKDRDSRIRRKILVALQITQSVMPDTKELSGTALMEEEPRFEDETHALKLLRELVAWELITERDKRTRKSQQAGLDVLMYQISGKGLSLLNEDVAPVPGVWDERIASGD